MTQQPHSFDAELGRLTDDARRAEASKSRRRRADRSVAASLSATFRGTLIELMETAAPSVFLTRTGSTIRGHVSEVGPEVVVITSAASTRTVLRIGAIDGIREHGNGHDRHFADIAHGVEFSSLLDGLAQDRSRLSVTLASANKVMGVIERVGLDQLVLRLDGNADVLTIPLDAIDQVVIEQ